MAPSLLSALSETFLPPDHQVEYVLLLTFPLLVGMVTAGATAHSVATWYRYLQKPWFTPPGPVFGPVWTVFYLAMGYASFVVYRALRVEESGGVSWVPLYAYGVQLALNVGWSPLFFWGRNVRVAFGEIVVLWVAIGVTVRMFWAVSEVAAVILVPYWCFVTFAAMVNYSVMRMNPTPITVVGSKRM